jgi:hypothetical protein
VDRVSLEECGTGWACNVKRWRCRGATCLCELPRESDETSSNTEGDSLRPVIL